MFFSDHALSCRLEVAEGYACREFAMARRRLFPESRSEVIRVAGAEVVYGGRDPPLPGHLAWAYSSRLRLKIFERSRNSFEPEAAPTQHKISPFAGALTVQLLCARGYRPIVVSQCFVPAD
jgi:hypothetical protein